MGARLLLVAPLFLLTAASSPRWTIWYLITAEDGRAIGYASEEEGNGPGIDSFFLAMSLGEQGQPATRITDHVMVTRGGYGRALEIVERLERGGEWTEFRAKLGTDAAIVTRKTRAETRTRRIKLPPRTFPYDYLGMSRCPITQGPVSEYFELNLVAMAVERVVYRDAPDEPVGETVAMVQRYAGDTLLSVGRLNYDGDCQLVSITRPLFGKTVTIRYTDRETALANAPAAR